LEAVGYSVGVGNISPKMGVKFMKLRERCEVLEAERRKLQQSTWADEKNSYLQAQLIVGLNLNWES